MEVMTDEKLPNRLTGLHRRQIHCPRLRKYSNNFHKLWKIFHKEQKYQINGWKLIPEKFTWSTNTLSLLKKKIISTNCGKSFIKNKISKKQLEIDSKQI